MNFNLKNVYQETLNEYNKTPLATKDGWYRDYSEYNLKQIEMISSVINFDDKILDIGTGSGIIPIFFNKIGYDVTTIDYVESGVTLLKILIFLKLKIKMLI